jgi:hypothetical protein
VWPLEAGHAKASIPNEHLLPPEAEMGTRGLNGRSLQPSGEGGRGVPVWKYLPGGYSFWPGFPPLKVRRKIP